jgi:hypothetical protein
LSERLAVVAGRLFGGGAELGGEVPALGRTFTRPVLLATCALGTAPPGARPPLTLLMVIAVMTLLG